MPPPAEIVENKKSVLVGVENDDDDEDDDEPDPTTTAASSRKPSLESRCTTYTDNSDQVRTIYCASLLSLDLNLVFIIPVLVFNIV